MSQMTLFDAKEEARKRDAALDLLEEKRAALIGIARACAERIVDARGEVTAPEVFAAMAEMGVDLGDADPRFMGAVFRSGGKGTPWIRLGYRNAGSHKRPVSVWTRKR